MYDLQGDFFGTIHVARPYPSAFTRYEIQQTSAAGRLIGRELARRDEYEYGVLQRELYQLTLSLVARKNRNQIDRSFQGAFYRTVLDCLCQYLGAEEQLIFVPSPVHHPRGYGLLDNHILCLDFAQVQQALRGEDFRVVSLPKEDPSLRPFFASLKDDIAADSRQSRLCVNASRRGWAIRPVCFPGPRRQTAQSEADHPRSGFTARTSGPTPMSLRLA